MTFVTSEAPHDKSNKMTCAPSEDSDQPGHPPSLIRVSLCALWIAKDRSDLHADGEDFDSLGAQVIVLFFVPRFLIFVSRYTKRVTSLTKQTTTTTISTENI